VLSSNETVSATFDEHEISFSDDFVCHIELTIAKKCDETEALDKTQTTIDILFIRVFNHDCANIQDSTFEPRSFETISGSLTGPNTLTNTS
jgi:hypothetical protein